LRPGSRPAGAGAQHPQHTGGPRAPKPTLHPVVAGAASQFFCGPGNAGGVADGDALSAVTDSTDECVFRDDTLVLLEMTTRDMMEVGSGLGSGGLGPPRPALPLKIVQARRPARRAPREARAPLSSWQRGACVLGRRPVQAVPCVGGPGLHETKAAEARVPAGMLACGRTAYRVRIRVVQTASRARAPGGGARAATCWTGPATAASRSRRSSSALRRCPRWATRCC